MTLNLATIIEESAKVRPEESALLLGGGEITYAGLQDGARRFASGLSALGIEPGEKVAMLVPNVPQFAVAYYGILSLGAVVVPLNVLLKEGEISYHLEDSDAVALVVWEGFLEEAAKGFDKAPGCREIIVVESPGGSGARNGMRGFDEIVAGSPEQVDMAQTMPDDTAVLLYTSGTTGRPKGAELSHFNMFYNAAYCADRLFKMGPDDVVLGALPLFHVFGQTCAMNAAMYSGGKVALLPRFEPGAALETIKGVGVTIFLGVPTMYQYLLRHPELDLRAVSSLRLAVSGGSAMPVEVLRAFEAKSGATILEGYGLSETSPAACFNRTKEVRKVGSVGLPIWGTEVRVMDAEGQEVPRGERGELVVKGHNVMKGYYKRPDATSEALRGGWFHTGDVATMDEEGFVFIVDRIKDMILRGGYNVYPREVEEVLYDHPAVAECAVVGVPHEELGEEVRALVVLKECAVSSEEEIVSFAKERLAAYKYPRSVGFESELPKTTTGKILKRQLVAAAR